MRLIAVTNSIICVLIATGCGAEDPPVIKPHNGEDSLVVAPGPDPNMAATVRVLDPRGGERLTIDNASGNPADRFGARVAACDLDGDGWDELVVGSGAGASTVPKVVLLTADGSPFAADIVPTFDAGVGVELACGDVDGDGKADIVVAPGPAPSVGQQVTIYRADGTLLRSFSAGSASSFGARVAVGDVAGDGKDEIIVAPTPEATVAGEIEIFTFTGERIARFTAFAGMELGAHVAAGDVDGDGTDEIIVSPGPHALNPQLVEIYRGDGTKLGGFRAKDPDPHIHEWGYWGVNQDGNDNSAEVAAWTSFAQTAKATDVPLFEAQGMKVIFTTGFPDDETRWPNRLSNYQTDLAPYVASGTIVAFHAIDEPELRVPAWDGAKQDRLIDMLHGAFPGIPMIVAHARKVTDLDRSQNADIISVNAYMWNAAANNGTFDNTGCTDRVTFDKAADQIRWAAGFGKPVLATLPSFSMTSPFPWNFNSLCQHRWYWETVLSVREVNRVMWFLWADNNATHVLTGTRAKPEVVAQQQQFFANLEYGAYGATLAVGDLDHDGRAEIVVGHGEGSGNSTALRIYTADGTPFADPLIAFTGARFGVSLALGRFNQP
jgi:hypothetical protein